MLPEGFPFHQFKKVTRKYKTYLVMHGQIFGYQYIDIALVNIWRILKNNTHTSRGTHVYVYMMEVIL